MAEPDARWVSQAWLTGERRFESAETNRLNSAHWSFAKDESVNTWLDAQLSTIRARAHYECKQNGMVAGMVNTHADDIVGQDGPSLQVVSDDDDYNEALEESWRDWFAAPTPDPRVSGTALLKQWIKSFWKSGEFLATLETVRSADTQIQLRINPKHPRLLNTPATFTGDSNLFMGMRLSKFRCPTQYFIIDETPTGSLLSYEYETWPADLVLHHFLVEEEGQLRGVPWLNTALNPSADLRDYDDQVQDAARQIADQSAMLYSEHPDAQFWAVPESINVQRRTVRTVPPGWKPFIYPATMPPVQYPDYRAERQRELGRPVSMPLARIRLDYSRYNFSSARLEVQNYFSSTGGFQTWISGTNKSVGPLNRLVDLVANEMRFIDPRLRRKPKRVVYQWTWPKPPHVDPVKESNAEGTSLANSTITLIDALAARGTDLETHIKKLRRVMDAFEAAEIPFPQWLTDQISAVDQAMVDAVSESIAEESVADA